MDEDDQLFAEIEANSDSDSNIEDVPLTAAEVIKLMEEAWLNEKFAPEILPNKFDIVECLLGQINYMQENLRTLKSTDFQLSIHQMEVDRLRFLVSSYLRTRLHKIETFVFLILKSEQQRIEKNEDTYLTENEMEFAQSYKESVEQHFEETLQNVSGIANDEWKNMPVEPNIHSFVFLKSKVDIEGVIIDDGTDEDGDLIDFKQGSQSIISYNSVSNLIKNGDVHLI
nr:DNA replication complex GINS protein SLD5 [Onthophagus taurus]